MKLKVKIITPESGQPYAALCDEEGNPLPGQQASHLECEVTEFPVITVRFVIDGDDIILE